MAATEHSHPDTATKAELADKFGELKAEIAELRGRVDMLLWAVGAGVAVTGIGFSTVIGILAATS